MEDNKILETESAPVTPMGKTIVGIEMQAYQEAVPEKNLDENDVVPMGTASLADIVTGNVPAPTEKEIKTAEAANAGDVHARAKQKLEEELKKANNKTFADPVIEYLLKRCEEDSGLSADVMQEHKTWDKCFDYIYSQARKQKNGNCAVVRDDVVFEWAEDYYHKDDKAEEERKAKQKTEKKKNQVPVKKDKTSSVTPKASASNVKVSKKPDVKENKKPEEKPKPKKKTTEMEGQMDFFSMMGL